MSLFFTNFVTFFLQIFKKFNLIRPTCLPAVFQSVNPHQFPENIETDKQLAEVTKLKSNLSKLNS
jgi:hypothetical protein